VSMKNEEINCKRHHTVTTTRFGHAEDLPCFIIFFGRFLFCAVQYLELLLVR
jgi:hypothetical protein